MKKLIAAGVVGLSLGISGLASAESIKVGMITTLSGGGAGLGVGPDDLVILLLADELGHVRDPQGAQLPAEGPHVVA